jgi:hypothetical protein
MNRRILSVVVGLALAFGLSAAVHAQEGTVLQAVAVDVAPGKLDTYLERVKQLQGVITRLGSKAQMRAWRSTLSGEQTGTVFVTLEFPNLAAFADTTSKTGADPEWQKIIGGLEPLYAGGWR